METENQYQVGVPAFRHKVTMNVERSLEAILQQALETFPGMDVRLEKKGSGDREIYEVSATDLDMLWQFGVHWGREKHKYLVSQADYHYYLLVEESPHIL